jgi:hypothetical protein
MNNNTINQIVQSLEAKGESKDYIIGFLTATLQGLRHIDDGRVEQYLEQTLKQSQK